MIYFWSLELLKKLKCDLQCRPNKVLSLEFCWGPRSFCFSKVLYRKKDCYVTRDLKAARENSFPVLHIKKTKWQYVAFDNCYTLSEVGVKILLYSRLPFTFLAFL